MTVINPPAWMQAGTYPARNDRLALSGLLSYPGFSTDEATPMRVRQGIKPAYQGYQMKVRAAATPNMTVIVSGGFAVIDQHDTGGVGTYVVANDGDVTLTVQPAGGAGQYRRDTVVVSVYDAEYAGTSSEARVEIIQGPYAASAGATVRGSLPSNAQLLADLAIAPSQTSVASGNITDVRQFSVAAGGILPVTSSATPNHPHPGQVMYQTDLDKFVYGDQSGTTKPVLGQWASYTPSLTNVTLGNGSVLGKYRKMNDVCDLQVLLNWGSTTTASGVPQFSLPVTPANDNMRWTGDALINPPGTFRTGVCWLYYNSTVLSVGAINATNGGIQSISDAGITMATGGWVSANISYAV